MSSSAIFEVKLTLGFADAIAGEVGSEDTQTDYTVIGDGVNQFFRIAKYHGQCGKVIINKRLHQAVENRYETESIDNVQVKGISEPIPIYEILYN